MSETVTLSTCRDSREARKIARVLVKEKLAACVNVVPGIASIYAWKGRIEEGREVLLVIKSRQALSKRLIRRVMQLHSYEIPEVLTLPVSAGNPDYLRWIREST